MTDHTLWQEYSKEVLAWQLGQPGGPALADTPADARHAAQRLLRMAATTARPWLTLMGVGDGTLAAHLLEALPDHVQLRILEPSPHRARTVLERFAKHQPDLLPQLAPCLLVDTSPWALLLLALDAGLTPDQCTVAHAERPRHGEASPEARVLEQWRKLFLAAQPEKLPEELSKAWAAAGATPRISVGAILHPAEPQLADFFRQIPPWVHELCVVWDGSAPNVTSLPCPVPLRQRVRVLGDDFSTQRNAMLELCTGDWCLYLDADERLCPEVWASLPALAALPHVGSVLFPRLTFEGSEEHIRMGYGLWPDVQCRLFPLNGRVHFQGNIHEQVHGLEGSRLLAPGMPIFHHSHIQKNRAQVEEKLRIFNKAAQAEGSALHVGSAAYPSLPRRSVEGLGACFGIHTVLRLPLMA